jgi:nitroreductase
MTPRFVPLDFEERPPEEMAARAEAFRALMARRRTTRQFATRPVPRALIEAAIATAATAPSGANLQPWTFVVVTDPMIKGRIREAAEAEERENYAGRMPAEWRAVLEPLGTDEHKPHLTDAPFVVVLFKHTARITQTGERLPTYYASESAGIAAGLFIAAVHNLGLVTLTHTPSPMGFLSEILGRPSTEKPYLVMPVGYPAPGATVPEIEKKPLQEVLIWR